MRPVKPSFLVPALLAAVLAACGGEGRGSSGLPDLPWARDYDEAFTRARAEGKLVMVDFYTDWCGWCKRLDRTTLSDPRVRQALARFVPVRLDAEKDGRAQADRLGVRGYPTIVFLDPAGAEVGRIGGYLEPGPFLAELDSIAAARVSSAGE